MYIFWQEVLKVIITVTCTSAVITPGGAILQECAFSPLNCDRCSFSSMRYFKSLIDIYYLKECCFRLNRVVCARSDAFTKRQGKKEVEGQ